MYKKEIEILKALDVLGFTHIARDKGGNIFVYLPKPIKDLEAEVWFFNNNVHPDEMQIIKLKRELFTFVDWKDKEPTNILNLLLKISNILSVLSGGYKMSKSIYDEALQEIQKVWNGNPLTYPKKTIKSLERAKKQEKLLELYKKLNEVCKELITLARHNSWSWDLDSEIIDLNKQIKELENE